MSLSFAVLTILIKLSECDNSVVKSCALLILFDFVRLYLCDFILSFSLLCIDVKKRFTFFILVTFYDF